MQQYQDLEPNRFKFHHCAVVLNIFFFKLFISNQNYVKFRVSV
jgi:hypothetical protein